MLFSRAPARWIRRFAAIGPLLLPGALAAPAVDPALPAYRPPVGLAGSVTLAGDPLLAALARAFTRVNPDVSVNIGPPLSSSAEAIDGLVAGKVQLAWLGPYLEPQEKQIAQRAWGRDPLIAAVATGAAVSRGNKPAIAIYVNAANPLTRLSVDELDAVFADASPRFAREAGALGTARPRRTLVGAPHSPLRHGAEQPGRLSARLGSFSNAADAGWRTFKPDIVQVPDTAYGPGANLAFVEIVRDVAQDPDAIAYSPLAAYRRPGVKTLALAEHPGGPYLPAPLGHRQPESLPGPVQGLGGRGPDAARGGPRIPALRAEQGRPACRGRRSRRIAPPSGGGRRG